MANLFDVYNDGLLVDHTEGEKLETGETPITISGLTADTTYDKVQVAFAGSYNKSDVPSFKTNLGRNLFIGSKDFSGAGWTDKYGNPYTLIPNDFQGLTSAAHQPQWSGPRYLLSVLEPKITSKPIDTTYVMSAWVKNTGTNTVTIGFYGSLVSQQNYTVIDIPAGSDWIRVSSKPFKLTKNSGLSGTIQFSNSVAVQGGVVKQAGLKLEVDKATDWTPAPEDATS